jgi:hypothetical protein
VQAKRTIHVLTDKRGVIVGGGILNSAKDREGKGVHVQIAPMKGQTLSEVLLPPEIQRLEGAEVFRRLHADYHLPRGKKELVRKAVRR